MHKIIRIFEFAKELFVDRKAAEQAGQIMVGIMEARSPRLSDVAAHMPGSEAASYKRMQRFLKQQEPEEALQLLFNEAADFVIADPTEIERPHAHKTAYVGTLRDGKTPGFWMLTLATPLRGRAIPFHFLTYSSRTFEEQVSSRNLEHFKAIQEIQRLVGKRPIVFDREFSYGALLASLVEAQQPFVIRLNLGSHPPQFYYDTEQKRPLRLSIAPLNKPKIYRQVYYQGQVRLNLIGIWRFGFKQPIWVMTNMEPEDGQAVYDQRMKIEICFRDLKSLLHIDQVMNKSQVYLNKMLAMVLLAYAVSVVVGEAIRDVQYAHIDPQDFDWLTVPTVDKHSRWYLFSGPFLLLKKRYRLSRRVLRQIVTAALVIFRGLIFGYNVRSFVPS